MTCFTELYTQLLKCEDIKLVVFAMFAYAVSIFPGCFLIQKFSDKAYKIIRGNCLLVTLPLPNRWSPQLVGVLERMIITTAIIFEVEDLLVLWYGVKVISKFNLWGNESEKRVEDLNGRAIFNVYLIGTGLSLVYGLLGGQIYFWLIDNKYLFILISILALILLNYIFILKTPVEKSRMKKRNS